MRKSTSLLRIISTIVFGSILSGNVQAFDLGTHEELSGRAVRVSDVDKVLKEQLGYPLGITQAINGVAVVDSVAAGSRFEDSPVIRVRHHFHNPTRLWNEAGLRVFGIQFGQSSVLWSQNPQQSPGGEYSWQDARASFFQALTAPAAGDRETAFANTFQSVGHLTHLIQDAASPAHTRNDAHLSYNGIGDPDGFHAWAERPENLALIAAGLSFDPAILGLSPNPLAPIPIARIIDTEDYRKTAVPKAGLNLGMAEYSNANFFSDDTAFTDFPFPAMSSVVLDPPETLPNGKKRRYFHKVRDGEIVNHLAFPSALYDFLPTSLAFLTTGLDDRVFQDYGSLLLSRAVGYSAGLINYFFRGKIDMVPVADTCCSFQIQNQTDEPMSGTFTVYYDDVDGNRRAVTGAAWTLPIAAQSLSTPVVFTPPQLGNITPANPDQYLLVFKGSLGMEVEVGEAFAVTAKAVTLKSKLASPAKWTVAGTVKSTGTAFNRSLGDTQMFSVENGVAKPVTAGVVSSDKALFLNLAEGVPAGLKLAAIGSNPLFSVSGGADIAKFSLKGDALYFIAAPDFDTPTDANLDNTYVVNVTTTDQNGLTDTQKIEATVKLMYNVTKSVSAARAGTATIEIIDTASTMRPVEVKCYTYGWQYTGGAYLWGQSPFLGTAAAWSTDAGDRVVTRMTVPYTSDEDLLQLMQEVSPQLPFPFVRAIATNNVSDCTRYAGDGCPDASYCSDGPIPAREFAYLHGNNLGGYPYLIRWYNFLGSAYVTANVDFATAVRPVPATTTYSFSPIADAALGIPYSKNTEGDVITERYTLITEQRIRPLTASF